ncbi:hypothetical protein LJC36_00865 [Desulfovibrio sp. OttesenSCG-928-C14]|nr:hypothetical protein [Desulfovibrio sp. OttesenSCG-928-C14]
MKRSLACLFFLLFVAALPYTAAAAAEMESDPEGHGREFTKFYKQIAGYDLASIFLEYREHYLGIIGKDLQRFYIYFSDIRKSPDSPYLYQVRGKTRVKNNICDFTGTFTVVRSGIAVEDADGFTPGFVIAAVALAEDKKQPGTGSIKGELFTKFYLSEKTLAAENYGEVERNHQFIGTWTSYKTGAAKVCNFGAYRIPNKGLPAGISVDQGDGVFAPKPIYHDKGWKTYYECFTRSREAGDPYCLEETRKWWTPAGATNKLTLPVRRSYEYLSAELPVHWKAREEGRAVTFEPKDGTASVRVTVSKTEAADAARLAQERAALHGEEDSAFILPNGRGFITSKKNTHGWLMVAGGWMLEIRVSQKHADVPDLIDSFREKPEYPGLGKALAVLKENSYVASWLSFRSGASLQGTPLLRAFSSARPDFASYGIIAGEKTTPPPALRKLPQGWTTTTVGAWAISTSADNSQWAAARTYPIAKGDMTRDNGTTLKETAQELAALLGGSNITSGEGYMEFDLPFGIAIIAPKKGNSSTIWLYSESSTASELFLLNEN